MKKNYKKGFTLVELIAVIAIIGILAAIIIPKFGAFTDSAKKSRAISDLSSVLSAVNMYNADHPDAIFEDTTSIVADINTMTGNASSIAVTGIVDTGNKGSDKYLDVTSLNNITKIGATGKGYTDSLNKSGVSLLSNGTTAYTLAQIKAAVKAGNLTTLGVTQ